MWDRVGERTTSPSSYLWLARSAGAAFGVNSQDEVVLKFVDVHSLFLLLHLYGKVKKKHTHTQKTLGQETGNKDPPSSVSSSAFLERKPAEGLDHCINT